MGVEGIAITNLAVGGGAEAAAVNVDTTSALANQGNAAALNTANNLNQQADAAQQLQNINSGAKPSGPLQANEVRLADGQTVQVEDVKFDKASDAKMVMDSRGFEKVETEPRRVTLENGVGADKKENVFKVTNPDTGETKYFRTQQPISEIADPKTTTTSASATATAEKSKTDQYMEWMVVSQLFNGFFNRD